MRPDPAKQQATQQERRKDEAGDLARQGQPTSLANRDRKDRADDGTGQEKVRSQDPNFGRGPH